MQEKLENCIAVDDFRIMMIDLWEFLLNILQLFIKPEVHSGLCTKTGLVNYLEFLGQSG